MSIGTVDACLDGSTGGRLCPPGVVGGNATLLVGDCELVLVNMLRALRLDSS